MDNNLLIPILTTVIGYLFGSISFARVIHYLVKKEPMNETFRQQIPGTDRYFEADLVSATTASLSLGKRYGCLVAIFDMLKVALPTALIKYFFPDDPWFLLAAAAGVGGHVYPIYHRFRGGRGESPMLGAFLVINWFGIFIANLGALVMGYLLGSVLVWRYGWYILTIFWYAWFFQDPWYIGFAVAANIFFWWSFRPDLKKFQELKKKDQLTFPEEEVSNFIMMGRAPGQFLDNYGLPALIRKLSNLGR